MNGEMDRKIERGFQIWELLIDSLRVNACYFLMVL